MRTTLGFILLFVLFFPSAALSGQIEDTFGGGIFGVKWGYTIDQVIEVFPGGKKGVQSGYPHKYRKLPTCQKRHKRKASNGAKKTRNNVAPVVLHR